MRWGALVAILWLMLGCSSSGQRQQGRVTPPPPQPSSSTQVGQAAEIRSLELREEGEIAYLDVVADRPLVWTNYRDSLGNLVVELPNSVPQSGVADLMTQAGLVASVEVERLDDAERPLTRLVIRTREDSEHSLTTEGATLELQLLPAGYEEPVALAYQPVAEEEIGGQATAPRRSFGTADEPLPGPEPTGVTATQLLSIDSSRAGASTVIHVGGDGEFVYSTFRLENPARFVIDLDGVVNTSSTSSLEVGTDLVDRVRVGQFKPRPDAVSRVVFDLRHEALPTIERSADGLSVIFGVAPTTLAQDTGAVSPPAEPEYQGEPEPAAPPVEVAEVVPEPEPEPPPMAPETEEFEPPPAAPEPTMAEPEPAMPEPTMAEPEPTMAEMGEPEPAAPEPAAPEPAAPEPAAPEPVPPPVPLLEPMSEPSAPPVEEAEPQMAEMAEPQPAAPEPSAPEPAEYQPAPPPLPPPRPSVSQPAASRDVSMFEAQRIEGVGGQQESRPVAPKFDSIFITRDDRAYTGEPINMSLKNADLVETLRSFASISGLNFVIQPGVDGSVTVELRGVPWDQAMEQILKINNLGMDIDGTIVRIAPQDQLRAEALADAERIQARRRAIPLRTVMKTLSYASANEVSTLLRNRTGAILSDRGTVQVDSRTNSLIIRELPSNIDTVLAVIENLDTPEPQVTIEARIIEATKTFARSLGIQWGFDALANNQFGNTTGLEFPNNYDVDGGIGLLTGGANGFLNMSMGNILNTFNLNARLQAAENEGLVNIISAPSVTTLNNFPAFIQSGLQIPIQTVTNRTVSVQFVNATLQLAVQPHVTAEGTIILRLQVAKRAPQLAFAIVGASNAPIATKEATTTVVVRDGGTAVIGGIYEVSTNQNQDRVPGLANIPIIGHLFKNRNRSEDNDELMIFVTPRIVNM